MTPVFLLRLGACEKECSRAVMAVKVFIVGKHAA
jgi:hypothetical protein